MTHYLCKSCGGELIQADGAWKCKYCGSIYVDENVKKEEAMLRSFLDQSKREKVANLRRNLYDALNAKYIDSVEICRICGEIKKLLPDDFMANFYYVANHGTQKEICSALRNTDAEEQIDYVEGVVSHMIKSLCSDYVLPLQNLVERAYKNTNMQTYERLSTMISDAAEKVSKGIYETSVPRDVFVAYSSKDMKKVEELVEQLEANGLECFVAVRNLRHGRGAVQNYERALHEAMDNCKSVVFVSTKNSRTMECDALRVELKYIKTVDILNAPAEFKNNYAQMPMQYKKPRVEYRLDNENSQAAAQRALNEFFSGLEYAYSPEEVIDRIYGLDENIAVSSSVPAPAVAENTKVCSACGTENPESSKFCIECGKKDFVESRAEYDMLKKLEAKKIDDAKRAEEEKKAEEARRAEEERRIEEKKKAEEAREAEREAKREAEYQKKTQKIAQRRKRSKKLKVTMSLVTVIAVIIAAIYFFKVGLPNMRYESALECIANGDYIEAYDLLLKIEGHDEGDQKRKEIFTNYKTALIKNANVGDKIILGSYEQDNDITSGKEDIEWVVLEKNDNRLFVISECALEVKKYSNSLSYTTWESSSVRTWLNESFFEEAFTFEEQMMIETSYVSARFNTDYPDSFPGNDTLDRIFLLDIEEFQKYMVPNKIAKCVATKYLKKQGEVTELLSNKCRWLLRTPGKTEEMVAYVGNDGKIHYTMVDGSNQWLGSLLKEDFAVRPAMWITINDSSESN